MDMDLPGGAVERNVGMAIDDRLFLHPSDTTGTTLIPFQLMGTDNYQIWSRAIMEGLLVKNKVCFIDGTCPRESVPVNQRSQWDRCNAIVKAWLRNAVVKDLVSGLIYNPTAQSIWEDLCEMFNKVDGTRIFQLHRDIYHVTQGTLSITTYFGKLKMLWDELAAIDDLVLVCEDDIVLLNANKEKQKLIQFLIGLNETFASVRSALLMRQPLPSLSVAYPFFYRKRTNVLCPTCLSMIQLTPTQLH